MTDNDMIFGLLIHLGHNMRGDGCRGKYLDAVDQLAGAIGKVNYWRKHNG